LDILGCELDSSENAQGVLVIALVVQNVCFFFDSDGGIDERSGGVVSDQEGDDSNIADGIAVSDTDVSSCGNVFKIAWEVSDSK
jgi:hypothetical protein